jgi:hypothetical protein
VVSKKDAGDRRTPFKAALKSVRLATKLARLNEKLRKNDEIAWAAPRAA